MSGNEMPVRIGLLRLTDSATVMVAAEHGLFEAEGLRVALSIEPSWANVADKLAFGLLDAAVMLPPLAIAAFLGLRGSGAGGLVVPMALSQGGNAVVACSELAGFMADAGGGMLERGAAIGAWARMRARRGLSTRLAAVHAFSGHALLLRYWLAASGVDPERDVSLLAVPPAQMTERLLAGDIHGFCVGAPWGVLGERGGAGRVVALGSEIWNRHPEKVLAVRADWAASRPDRLRALLRALTRAALLCDDPAQAGALSRLLAAPHLLELEADAIATSLGGAGAPPRPDADRIGFLGNAATMPWRSQAAWFAAQMARWGWLDPALVPEAAALYRPDLYRAAGAPLPLPAADAKQEGGHDAPWRPDRSGVVLEPDLFCDGARFDSLGRTMPVS